MSQGVYVQLYGVSVWALGVRWGKCPEGICPWGKCPGVLCWGGGVYPRTLVNFLCHNSNRFYICYGATTISIKQKFQSPVEITVVPLLCGHPWGMRIVAV